MTLTKKRAALMGGMGFPVTEMPWGMPAFKSKLEKLGFDVLLVSWKARQEVFNFCYGFDGFLMFAGDSLGAGSSGQYPSDLKGQKTDYAVGFQPSEDDARTVHIQGKDHGVQYIAPSISRAHCIYDPLWIQTGGLGHAQWEITQGAKTKLLCTAHYAAHPDDWNWSQTLVLNELQQMLNAPTHTH